MTRQWSGEFGNIGHAGFHHAPVDAFVIDDANEVAIDLNDGKILTTME